MITKLIAYKSALILQLCALVLGNGLVLMLQFNIQPELFNT